MANEKLISPGNLICSIYALTETPPDVYDNLRAFYHTQGFNAGLVAAASEVKRAPTVDAVEVVHGRWERYIDEEEDVHYYTCSACNYMAIPRYKYCPNCGAKMDGDENGTA